MPYIVLHEVTISFFLGYTTLQTKKNATKFRLLENCSVLTALTFIF